PALSPSTHFVRSGQAIVVSERSESNQCARSEMDITEASEASVPGSSPGEHKKNKTVLEYAAFGINNSLATLWCALLIGGNYGWIGERFAGTNKGDLHHIQAAGVMDFPGSTDPIRLPI